MLFLFQWLFLVVVIVAIGGVIRKEKDKSISRRGAYFWVTIWAAAGLVVLYPNSTARLAQFFGIGRGVDLVLYVSLATMFFLIFRLHLKIEGVRRMITNIVRSDALRPENIKK
jgi:hypothetical protein